MKKSAITLAATLMLMLPSLSFGAAKAKTFTGSIMDSQCAKMGSHDAMKQKAGIATDAECTKQCVSMGGKYVLYNADTKTVYELDDQKKPEEFAGAKVTVKGTYDRATKTIHVESIEAAK
jgi:uncharacterized protein DUF5818